MTNFQFETVKTILNEWGASRRLGQLLAPLFPARRALVVSDRGFLNSGNLSPALDSLKAAGYSIDIFDEVVPDPPEAVLHHCAELAKSCGAEIVIGAGGGSSLDVAKLAAVLAVTDQPLKDLYGIGNVRGERLPLVLIPTTAGTGSEVTNISIITTGETTKMGVVSSQLFADMVVLDAELTVGLPATHTAATGIDAMVHAIEAFTSRHKKNPVSDALAKEALRLLAANIEAVCKDGTDRPAREAMLLGAMLAGQAFANAPVAGVHALAYPLGGHFHIPHGLSNALMLIPVLRFNMRAAAHLYAELADSLGLQGDADVESRSEAFVNFMEALLIRTGAPRRLRDVKVARSALSMLADDAMKQERLLKNNPIEITRVDALALYEHAF